MSRKNWLEKNGFNADEITYIIAGEDTYAIKDWLKEQGCKFNTTLKLHSPIELDLPEGYTLIPVAFDDIAEYDNDCKEVYYYEKAKAAIERKIREAAGPSLSEYIGEVGDRLRHITAIFKSTRGFAGAYGWTNIHTFQRGEDILVWFTACDIELEYGTVVDLSGTIVRHEEFRGVKTTKINRCIIKKVE